jgi:acyl carrier protein
VRNMMPAAGAIAAEGAIFLSVARIYRDVLNDEAVILAPQVTHDDIGLDSMKIIIVILAVEEHFGIRMRADEIESIQCIADVVNIVILRLASRTNPNCSNVAE